MSDAQKAEATDQPIKVTFEGHDYEVPPSSLWPIEVTEYMAEASTGEGKALQLALATRALLGPEQWARFKQDHVGATAPFEFWRAMGQGVGVPNP